jgi:ATP-dependent exoDNAse (exonuclease V) beta subunit
MSFYVYNASAGSGKTFTLVKEYLKMAMAEGRSDGFRKILAMTFTNKAAAEMKERVLRFLDYIAEGHPQTAPIVAELCQTLQKSEAEVQEQAARLLRSILHNYSDFSIGTIDSFMHRVVRTFAFDLHLPMNFNVVLEKDQLIALAVDQLIDKAGVQADITEILKGFTISKTDDEKGFQVRKEILEAASDLLDEQHARAIRKLEALQPSDFLALRAELLEFCKLFESRFQNLGQQALQAITEAGIVPSAFYQGSRGVYGFFRKAAQFERGLVPVVPNSYASKSLDEELWTSKSAPAHIKAQIQDIAPRLQELAAALRQLEAVSGMKYRTSVLILRNIFTVALLSEISREMDTIRTEQFMMHISEFNRRVAEIVFHEPAPFIFERLGEKFSHFLIDEFQDTSVLQWQNLLPLVHNGLATASASLLVGDGKQAIYRFRGGDVEQFIRLPQPYPNDITPFQKERYRLLEHYFEPRDLDTNYRSRPEITGWNNAFFQFIAQNHLNTEYARLYSSLNQKSPEGKTGGLVQVEFLQKAPKGEDKKAPHLERILQLVRETAQTGHYAWSDMAVLTRSNSEGKLVARHLLADGIPVISGESLLLSSSPEVQFIVAWLRVLAHQNPDVHLLHILHYLMRHEGFPYQTLPDLVAAVSMHEQSVLELLRNLGWQPDPTLWRTQSLAETCHAICRCFGLDVQRDPFLQFFLDTAWFANSQQNPDLSSFLEYWDEQSGRLSISLPQGANAVRIMTIHKSKGLQFPVVLFPFANNESKKSRSEWIEDDARLPEALPAFKLPLIKDLEYTEFADRKELENQRSVLDTTNLLYVALTRPEDILYILSDYPDKALNEAGWGTYLYQFAVQQETLDTPKIKRWGSMPIKNIDPKPSDHTHIPQAFHPASQGWKHRIKIHRKASRFWDREPQTEAIRWGKLVHEAFAKLHYRSDLERSLEQLVESGMCLAPELDTLRTMMLQVIDHPELKGIFDRGQVFTEQSLLDGDNHMHIPDRIVLDTHCIRVFDFKTGMPDERHVTQMQRYISVLQAQARREAKKLEAWLIYLGPKPEIRAVHAAM